MNKTRYKSSSEKISSSLKSKPDNKIKVIGQVETNISLIKRARLPRLVSLPGKGRETNSSPATMQATVIGQQIPAT